MSEIASFINQFPSRCFTCGDVIIASKRDACLTYMLENGHTIKMRHDNEKSYDIIEESEFGKLLTSHDITKPCCRRMYLCSSYPIVHELSKKDSGVNNIVKY